MMIVSHQRVSMYSFT